MYHCFINEPWIPYRAVNFKQNEPGLDPRKRSGGPVKMPTCLKLLVGSKKVSFCGGEESLITSERSNSQNIWL